MILLPASMDLYTCFFVCLLLLSAILSDCQQGKVREENPRKYNECVSPYSCGTLQFPYPFWGGPRPKYCGAGDELFNLTCHKEPNDSSKYALMDIGSQKFRVLNISQSRSTIRIVRWDTLCPENTTLPTSNLRLDDRATTNLTLSICDTNRMNFPGQFTCKANRSGNQTRVVRIRDDENSLQVNRGDLKCQTVRVPVQTRVAEEAKSGRSDLRNRLRGGFDVRYISWDNYCQKCNSSGGICGSNETSPELFVCFCPENLHPSDNSLSCLRKSGSIMELRPKIITAAVAVSSGILLSCLVCYFCRRHEKRRYYESYVISRNTTHDAYALPPEFEKHAFPGVHFFVFSEIEEATDSFNASRELGDGGFGTVYYGKLQDGREVAVKRLHESNYKRVAQFLNEVVILARLKHPNLVSLHGCTCQNSRELLLVYEYVTNGALADVIHAENSSSVLPWPLRLNIAMETASALSYLHNMGIIHRDIKTRNILLDESFHVKLADFGLSRLFPTDATHVSTAPQGTPGYIDPDYHECYQLTDKSDVFSFGVVLIELISSMPAVDITRQRHAINLSNMARSKIQKGELPELVDPRFGFGSDPKVTKTVTAAAELAFLCLQGEKELRPSMAEAVQWLQRQQQEEYGKSEEVASFKIHPFSAQSPDSVTIPWESSKSA